MGLAVEDVNADWFRLTTNLSYLKEARNPHEKLMAVARVSSGSIEGEHRKDLTTAIVGSPLQQSSLSVGIANLPTNGQKVIDTNGKKQAF